jgi:hypothetical protein
MPWVRFDDHFPVNRKVDGLSDTAFRLHVSAIFWCARNLTDGVVPEEDLELVTARVRAPARFGTELVRRGLWHEAGFQCDSEDCPPSGPNGWVIHDYWEYQPSKSKVVAERAANAERQARWRERQAEVERNALHGANNGRSNGISNGRSNSAPTRPDHKESSSNSLSSDTDERFDEFWRTYPPRKNNSKHKARIAYEAALKRGVDPAEILTALQAYAKDRVGENPQYTKQAVTWLHARPWEEPEPLMPPERAKFAWEA